MSVALYPGAFKPPHKGHFQVVKSLLDGSYNGKAYGIDDFVKVGDEILQNKVDVKPKIDKVIVFPGGGERNGITKDESIRIWQIYSKYLPGLEVLDGEKNPMFAAKDYAKANPKVDFYGVTGIRGGEDVVDLKRVTTYKNTPNVKGLAISNPGFMQRASELRKIALTGNLDDLRDYFPSQLKREELFDIVSMLKDSIVSERMFNTMDSFINEWLDNIGDTRLTEASSGTAIQPKSSLRSEDRAKLVILYNYLYNLTSRLYHTIELKGDKVQVGLKELEDNKSPYLPYIGSLLEYMLEEKMNITPLPEVKIRRDITEASNFFGKTAHYNPGTNEIVLYVEGRHPKDVVRSFSHEMIHHMQNLDGRLGNIGTTDTNEDSSLLELEKEAYLLGNITFRNWEDKIKNDNKEMVNEIITKPVDNNIREISQDYFGLKDFVSEVAKGIINEGKYDRIVTYLTNKSIEAVKNALTKKLHFYKENHFGDPNTEDARVTMKKTVDEVYPILIMSIPEDIDKKFQKETDLEFDYDMKAIFVKGSNSIMRDGGAYKGGFDGDEYETPKIELEFVLDPYNFPRDFEELSAQISDVLRHEIEHLTQAGGNVRGKTFGKDSMFGGKFGTEDEMRFRTKIARGVVKNGVSYLTLPSEIDANIQGLYLTAKKQRRPFKDVVDQYLYQFTDQYDSEGKPYLTKQDVEDVKKVWALRLPALGIKQRL